MASSHDVRALSEVGDTDPATIFSNETLRVAVHRMAETNATRLIVVNAADANKLVGKLALHDVLKARVRHVEEEKRRERILPWEYIVPRWLRRPTQTDDELSRNRRDCQVWQRCQPCQLDHHEIRALASGTVRCS